MSSASWEIEGSDVARRRPPASTSSITSDPHPAAWVYLLVTAYAVLAYCLLRFVLTTEGQRFPAVLVGVTATIFGLLFTTSARFSQAHPLCPKNWTLFLFALQLLAMSVLITSLGPVRGALPALPSDEAINAAVLLNAVAYISFLAGYSMAGVLSRLRTRQPSEASILPRERLSIAVIGMFVLLGIVGLVFHFQTLANLADYFLGPADFSRILANRASARATLGEAAGTFLSCALGFAFVLLWCRSIEKLREHGGRHDLLVSASLVAIAGLIAVSYAVYFYNRGAVLVPLLALLAAYSLRKRRIPFTVLAITGLLMIVAAFEFGNVRTVYFNPQGAGLDYNQQIQIYGSAPQFTAFMLEEKPNDRLYPGQTLLSSLLYPIPAFGRNYRATSGVAIYNGLIYGFDGPTDQVVPFQGELFWNFGVPGIIIGFIGLGALIARLQTGFENSRTALHAYMIQYASIWLGFLVIGSLAVVSQIVIYLMWPFLAMGILFALPRRYPKHPRDRT
jgi:hypothetical protein